MIVQDKNLTLQPPDGKCVGVYAEGAYLRLVYHHRSGGSASTLVTTLFLQDIGREVVRTTEEVFDPLPEPEPAPKKWWERLIDLLP